VRGITPRRRRRARARKSHPLLITLLMLGGLLVGVAAVAAAGVYRFGSTCDLSALEQVAIGENSFVYAADGSLLGAIPAERNRQPVSLKRMSPWIPKATVAIEDRRFYEHHGVDAQGIARAVLANVRARSVVEGGSTITQQLVRVYFLGYLTARRDDDAVFVQAFDHLDIFLRRVETLVALSQILR
jgi:penicillin-binding protein 1A